MRLKSYILNENENNGKLLNDMAKECAPFIKELIKANGGIDNTMDCLYRGYNGDDKVVQKKITRTDRNPKDTYIEVQELLDEEFYKHLRVRPRSTGVFATPDDSEASSYGKIYTVLPTSPYKLIWSPKIIDLYGDLIEGWQDYWTATNNDSYDSYSWEYEEEYGPQTEFWYYDGDKIEGFNEDEKAEVIEYIKNEYGSFSKHKLVWRLSYTDSEMNDYIENRRQETIDELENRLRRVIKTYKVATLKEVLSKKNEVMIICKSYYLTDNENFMLEEFIRRHFKK